MDALVQLALRLFPGGNVEELRPLGGDEAAHDATHKQIGYGVPVRIAVRDRAGEVHRVVFHSARADAHGHDHRADRVAEMLLAFDATPRIPRHVAALEVGVIAADGALRSLSGTGEPYLVTEWAEGTEYAEDLRRAAVEGASHQDHARVDALADYLVALHTPDDRASLHARELRDVIGGGEGIFGIVDGYPADAPAAPAARLRRIEERCVAWRWRLRGRSGRLRRIHGDFHPFNIVFAPDGQLRLLDASRGCAGDPANDLTALAINYVFFALDHPGAWRGGLGALWRRLWDRYLERSGDREVLAVAAPYLAWRALVVASPRWYPGLSADGRDRLLTWIEHVLGAPRLDLASADGVAP